MMYGNRCRVYLHFTHDVRIINVINVVFLIPIMATKSATSIYGRCSSYVNSNKNHFHGAAIVVMQM